MEITGKIVDIFNRRIFNGKITVEKNKIVEIVPTDKPSEVFILPGFVDSHVHIESSMLRPRYFSKKAVSFGTIACVCDPHEIANVLGKKGIDFMIKDSQKSSIKFFFGAPSCVPATDFETSGAKIDEKDIDELLQRDDIYFLAEMMNYPGVIHDVPEVISKLQLAKKFNKPIDGHSPLLNGENLRKYVEAGITTDHECTNIAEAREKIALGMKILIRNGSAAKDFDNLFPLIDEYPNKVMLCTDDCHPDDLQNGHINILVKEATRRNVDLFNVLFAASVNPVVHYNLPVGLLRKGDFADFIVVDNLSDFNILQTFVNGKKVFDTRELKEETKPNNELPNNFVVYDIQKQQISLKAKSNKIKVIVAKDSSLLTEQQIIEIDNSDEYVKTDIQKDLLKIVVVNRYKQSQPSVGFISGFGLKSGAIATSVAHDSHNIIAVGTNDDDILQAISLIQTHKGGMCVVDKEKKNILPLPIAGLMSNEDCTTVAKIYQQLNDDVKKLGSKLTSPFMTLSFMALLVIPRLKFGDKGLFDVDKFQFTDIFVY